MAARTVNSLLPQVTGIQQPTVGHWGIQLPRLGSHLSPQDPEFWGGISALIKRSWPSPSAGGAEAGSRSSHLWPAAREAQPKGKACCQGQLGHPKNAPPWSCGTCPGSALPALVLRDGLWLPVQPVGSWVLRAMRVSESTLRGQFPGPCSHPLTGAGLGDRAGSPKRQVLLLRNAATC